MNGIVIVIHTYKCNNNMTWFGFLGERFKFRVSGLFPSALQKWLKKSDKPYIYHSKRLYLPNPTNKCLTNDKPPEII